MRKDYAYASDGVPLYERPCGCSWPGSHCFLTGIRCYYRRSPLSVSAVDVCECLVCGAVWRQADVVLA